MALVPLRDLYYVLPMDDPSEIGKIINEAKDKRRADQGIVWKRGPKADPEIPIGAHVFYHHYSGVQTVISGIGRIHILRYDDFELILDDVPEEVVVTLERSVSLVRRAFVEHSRKETEEGQRILARVLERIEEHFETMIERELTF